MGYYNMIFQYGENKFITMCKKTGVNGIIVDDLPYPENKILLISVKENQWVLY